MSLSNPSITNPAKHFFEWKGQAGQMSWYDKENKQNVGVKLPFEFIVLDQLFTIAGYSKSDESGIWSNEVRNIVTDVMFTRTKKGPLEAKTYGELGVTVKKGGKFARSIYIAHKGEGGRWMIGNFKAVGSAASAWIEFTKRNDVEKGMVVVTRGEQQEAPTGLFYPPTFSWKQWNADDLQQAVALDRELQTYLEHYLKAPKVDDDAYGTDEATHESPGATPEQQADFEARKASGLSASAPQARPTPTAQPTADQVSIEDFQDEPINLDDIPF